ncbi:hypothetical protein EVAR_36884_1 [Eumeta japonica]|uniref:Uncharacterized protein n=1 Tax=Eumeta variegata TaxID=151549 RepID=A0A4C1WRW3_EUMVA|nr:hypothetical protein EVAR_36884_1 [Eumeta japonica]
MYEEYVLSEGGAGGAAGAYPRSPLSTSTTGHSSSSHSSHQKERECPAFRTHNGARGGGPAAPHEFRRVEFNKSS